MCTFNKVCVRLTDFPATQRCSGLYTGFCYIFSHFGRDFVCIPGDPNLAAFGEIYMEFLARERRIYVHTLADLQVVLGK